MIEPNIYCKVCGMTMQCIGDFFREFGRRPLVVEIGCADGQGTMRYAGFVEKVICIDPMVEGRPDIDSRKKSSLPTNQEKLRIFKERTKEFPVELILGCSLWPEVIQELKARLDRKKIDILVIDGCHHPFEAVWGDFAAYEGLVTKGGYVVFDDLYEECILQAYEKAINEKGWYKPHDRWGINIPGTILQDTGALKKVQD